MARVQPRRPPSGASLAGLVGRASAPVPGTAWSETLGGRRAVYRGERRKQESLLLFDPPAGEWLPRKVAFNTAGGPLAFEARSLEPRRLAVLQGEERIAEVPLTSDWTPVRVAPAKPGRLFLEADGCSDSDLVDGQKQAELECHSFQIRGLRLTRIELYDVSRDPGQIQELSRERARTTRALLRDLVAFNPRPVAAASAAPPIDPELEKSLRALGYLK